MAGEQQGIVGAASVPAASNFAESMMSPTALAATRGDLAILPPQIDICGFLGGLELPAFPDIIGAIISTIEQIISAITGVVQRIIEEIFKVLNEIMGFIQDAIDYIANAIRGLIPEITCGAPIVGQVLGAASSLGGAVPQLGSALAPIAPVTEIVQALPSSPTGIDPMVEVVSPDVTVRSIDDTLDAGEFGGEFGTLGG